VNRLMFYLIVAFVIACFGVGAVNIFGSHGAPFVVYFLIVVVLLALIFKRSMLVLVCVGVVLFYFWRPFSGSPSAQSPTSCPSAPRAGSALRGPYSSIDQLMRCDSVGPYALQLTGSGTTEYGFVILRDRRGPAYYATAPVRSSQAANPSCLQRPMIQPQDFLASWMDAISGAHVDRGGYVWAATVHTHPACSMASNNFSATDFNQAIVLKNAPADSVPAVDIEKIVMINANDRKVRAFTPMPGDTPFTTFGIEASDRFLPYANLGWDRYALRVQVLTTFP
jgi:hypothetical protein